MQDVARDFYQNLTNTRIIEIDGNSWLLGWLGLWTLMATILFMNQPALAFISFVMGCLGLKLVHGTSAEALDAQRERVASLVDLLTEMEKAADKMKGCALDPKHPEWNLLQEGIQELKASAVKRRHLLKLIEQSFGCRVQAGLFKWFKRRTPDGQ